VDQAPHCIDEKSSESDFLIIAFGGFGLFFFRFERFFLTFVSEGFTKFGNSTKFGAASAENRSAKFIALFSVKLGVDSTNDNIL